MWVNLFAIKPCFIDLIIGIPPPTAASNNKFTPYFSASIERASPCFAIKALLAVTTCLFFFIESKTIFLATPSEPPINSTIISILGSFIILDIFFSINRLGIFISLFFLIFFALTFDILSLNPVFFFISDAFFFIFL